MNTGALTQWAHTNPWPATLAAIAALLLLAATVRALVRAARRGSGGERPPAAVLVAALAAAACTAYSADTSWRFAAHHLGMTSSAERAAMFAAAELALFAVALMARQNLRTQGAPGTPGLLVWVITGVQIIPAFSESGFWGGIVRAFVGPMLAALLWHLAMGIELRHAKPGALSNGLPAVLARELRERLLSRLGLATRGRDAQQITRDRWTLRAVALAARLADIAPEKRSGWRARCIARRLQVAVDRAQAGASPEQRQTLLALLAARRYATQLATVALPSPWQAATTRRSATDRATPAATAPGQTATASVTPAVAPKPAAATSEPTPNATATPLAPPAPAAATDGPSAEREFLPGYQPGSAHQIVYELWAVTGHRPLGPDIQDALRKAGLPHSEQQARKIRLQVQRENPELPGPRAA